MRITMVGTGYVGLVTGVCFAATGNDVTCLDIDDNKIATLRRGESPIYEPGLSDLMRRSIDGGRLHFTSDKAEAYDNADMIFICVGTPTGEDGSTDLSFIEAVADDIADALKRLGPDQTPKTVVVKSTVPVGTTHAVRDRIRARAGNGIAFRVADNPEFLKEGDAINDFMKPDRVVIGVEDAETERQFRDLYDPFVRNGHPVFFMDVRSSEMVKYAANNFLATKISFINEMANLCEHYGADINEVRRGMCSDKRIGSQFLYPGLGYGGSCFPKDTLACMAMGDEVGLEMQLSTAVHEVNQRQRERFFEKIATHFAADGLRGRKLAFWGLAFKPRTDDIREAPALTLIQRCLDAGASCVGFDPVAASNAAAEIGSDLAIANDLYDCVVGADALVVSTDWDEFKSPDFARLASSMKGRAIFDGRNLYRPETLAANGFIYHSVGRVPIEPDAVSV